MAAPQGSKRKNLSTPSDKEITVANVKAKLKAKKALIRAKAEERAGPKFQETLTEAQKALRTAQAKVKRERQARIKAEKALTEAQEALAASRVEVEQARQTRIRRVSFVVRLTVDEHGQFRRTEIEHVESSTKQNFLSLDGERLVAFIKACIINPTSIPEPAIPPAPPSEKVEAPTSGPLRPKSSLIVSDVQVFRLVALDLFTLILTPEEPFIVEAHFLLQGPQAQFLTTQESSFEIKIYANEVSSGKSQLLTTYTATLIQDVLKYTAPVQMHGLSHGLYRLFTIVTLHTPTKLAGFYGKTIIHVI